MKRLTVILAILLAFSTGAALAAEKTPWWKEQKLQIMWGQWDMARADKSKPYSWNEILPRELFRNVAQAGGRVFLASRGHRPENAKFAHEFGMKYFATRFMKDITDIPGRLYVQENGEEFHGSADHATSPSYRCPLDASVYEKLLVEPYVEGLKAGLIDGIHTDWEYYSGNGDAKGVCYCDDCFSRIGGVVGIKDVLPAKDKRFPLLNEKKLNAAYEKEFRKQRVEMFAGLAKKIRSYNQDFMFSCYGQWLSDFTKGVHSADHPLIVMDPMHYYNDDRQPWWESYSARLKAEGYIYIPGGWTNSLFGAQVSQVSAARWIYEAMVNEDGCWLWFERELDDEILRAYSTADRAVKTVENKVGRFLFDGKRDPSFVTPIEWTGRPELAQAVIASTYYLGRERLAHINNVDTDWPVRVRVRFPRFAADKQWIVRDPISDLYYSLDGKSTVWTTTQLDQGLVLSMDPRSDLFLLITPVESAPAPGPLRLVRSADFETLPDHAAAAAKVPDIPTIDGPASSKIVFTATEPMGYEGGEAKLTIGNAIKSVVVSQKDSMTIRQLQGHLWSPVRSRDGSKIAFVHDTHGRGQIFIMGKSGDNVSNLSNNKFCDRFPAWSPDGKRIAFLSDRSGDWDIWVMNSDGTGQKKLAGNPGLDFAPAFSPNGKQLMWESHVAGSPSIWVCEADGKNPHPLISPDKPLSITPYYEGDVQVSFPDNWYYLRNADWSPDSKRIAAAGLFNVVVVDADGSKMQEVVPWMMGLGKLAWSPDGATLACTARTAPAETERSGVFTVKPGSKEIKWLVETTPTGPRIGGAQRSGLNTWYSHGSAQPRRVIKSFGSLCWSSDGKSLAYTSDIDPTGAFYVYTVPADGGTPTRIDATRSAWPNEISWQPGP